MTYRPFKAKKKRNLGKFRSVLEKNFAAYLKRIGVDALYEPCKIPYIIPAKNRNYLPDFVFDPKSRRRCKKSLTLSDLHGKIIIELKGRLTAPDRDKMLWVKEHNPELDIRFVFLNDRVINKGKKGKNGKYRNSDWCEDHDFPYHIGEEPPKGWFK